jgi:GT2 family glycosyltransferase
MNNVAVVIPSVRRPEGLLRAIESVLSTTDGVKVVCVLEASDNESMAILVRLVANSRVFASFIDESLDPTTAERWNHGAKFAQDNFDTEYFVIGADDVVFQPGWLEAAMAEMNAMGGSGLVGLNEGPDSSFGRLATHFLVSRKYAVRGLGGTIMIPPYRHGWTDMEATFRAKRDGRLRFAEDARIEHLHPLYGTSEVDEIYKKGQSTHDQDEELFQERLKAGFPDDFEPVLKYGSRDGWGSVAVGVRLYRNSDWQFIASWSRFLISGLRPGDRLLEMSVAAGLPHHQAANELVKAFLKSDCDSLLLIDDDMIIPYDALNALRDNVDNWDFDIVQGFCTHKSFPPHAVAYLLMDEQPGEPEPLKYGAIAHLPEDGVTEVDAVGAAITLIRREVLEDLISEYGPDYTAWFDFRGHSEMEDMRFSQRCKERGFKLAVDTRAKIGHVGSHIYGWPEYQKYIEMLEI